MIKWITDFTELPDSEVLAIGYQDNLLVGYLSAPHGDVECEADDSVLENVKGYILVSDLVKSFK